MCGFVAPFASKWNMTMSETWKPVVGFEGLYEVSSSGKVRGIKRGKIVSQHIHRTGYMYTVLTKNSKPHTLSVHRIVAKAFIPNPDNKREVNHKDFNKTNNNLKNLEWATTQENRDWNLQSEKLVKKRKETLAKMTEKTRVKVNQYDLNGNFVKTWDCIRSAGKTLKIDESNISTCCRGRLKTSGGYIWRRA